MERQCHSACTSASIPEGAADLPPWEVLSQRELRSPKIATVAAVEDGLKASSTKAVASFAPTTTLKRTVDGSNALTGQSPPAQQMHPAPGNRWLFPHAQSWANAGPVTQQGAGTTNVPAAPDEANEAAVTEQSKVAAAAPLQPPAHLCRVQLSAIDAPAARAEPQLPAPRVSVALEVVQRPPDQPTVRLALHVSEEPTGVSVALGCMQLQPTVGLTLCVFEEPLQPQQRVQLSITAEDMPAASSPAVPRCSLVQKAAHNGF